MHLDFERDYGVDQQTGWSLTVDNQAVCEFARTAAEAIIEGMTMFLRWNLDTPNDDRDKSD